MLFKVDGATGYSNDPPLAMLSELVFMTSGTPESSASQGVVATMGLWTDDVSAALLHS